LTNLLTKLIIVVIIFNKYYNIFSKLSIYILSPNSFNTFLVQKVFYTQPKASFFIWFWLLINFFVKINPKERIMNHSNTRITKVYLGSFDKEGRK